MKTALQSWLGLRRYRHFSQSVNALIRVVRPRYEPEVSALSDLVQEGDVALEVGANYAQYSRVLSKLVGAQGSVYAFEPAQITYDCLVRNCRLMRLSNVYPYRLALSDQPGEMELFTPLKRRGVNGIYVARASLAPDPAAESLVERVPVETMDNFVTNQRMAKVSFVRCDVEGAEMKVFLGAQRVIETHRPSILVELHPQMLSRFSHSVEKLQEFFISLGYVFAIWRNAGLQRIEQLPSGNVFLLPSEAA